MDNDITDTLATCGGADREYAIGTEERVNNLDGANAANTARDKAEDVIGDVTSVTIVNNGADVAELTHSMSIETGDLVDIMGQSAKDESDECESDSASERTFLEAMTPDGQDYYLRLGYTPQRRSALRLSRIIARRQLLQRLEQGRYGANEGKIIQYMLLG